MPPITELIIASVLVIGATARITRAITVDVIGQPIRNLFGRIGKTELAAEFITCPWCVGFWVAVAAVVTAWHTLDYPFTCAGTSAAAAAAFTVSYVVGQLADREL